jgi:hypothetical protein
LLVAACVVPSSPIFVTLMKEAPGSSETSVIFLRSVRRLLVAACVVPSSPILVTLMKEVPGSSETSVLRRSTRLNSPEDTILHSHRRENLKSYRDLSELVRYLFDPSTLSLLSKKKVKQKVDSAYFEEHRKNKLCHNISEMLTMLYKTMLCYIYISRLEYIYIVFSYTYMLFCS